MKVWKKCWPSLLIKWKRCVVKTNQKQTFLHKNRVGGKWVANGLTCLKRNALWEVETVTKNLTQSQKYVFCKKFTIFVLQWWNLVKIASSWVENITWILAYLEQNCEFFTMNNEHVLRFGSNYLWQSLCLSSKYVLL